MPKKPRNPCKPRTIPDMEGGQSVGQSGEAFGQPSRVEIRGSIWGATQGGNLSGNPGGNLGGQSREAFSGAPGWKGASSGREASG